MLIFINKNIPQEAKTNLSKYGEIIEIYSHGVVDNYLSGHPDLFIAIVDEKIIYSPSLPDSIFEKVKTYYPSMLKGDSDLSREYPQCAAYNAVITNEVIIHKNKITDSVLIKQCSTRKFISVNQGMTRCSLIPLNDYAFITSDPGISNTLNSSGYDVLRVTTKGIILPGKKHGLFGGTCGIIDNKLFIIGSLQYYKDGNSIRDFCQKHNVKIIELYDGPLFDGGSILFLDY